MTRQLPRRLPPGETVTAAHYNALVDALQARGEPQREPGSSPLRELGSSPQRWNITSSFPIEVRRHAGGVHLSLAYTDRDAVIELTTSLSSGSSAKAKVLWLDGIWKESERDEITVYDVVGTMEGNPGEKGLAKFHRQSGRWIVWQLQC